MARRLRAGGGGLLGYFPSLGHGPLREATARHLASSRGIACDPGQVMILNSSMQAVDLIARVLLERGDRAWIEDPCFPNLRAALAMSGARVVPVPVDAHGLDVRAGARARRTPALVYVTPSCQYPTGATLSLARRLELLRYGSRVRRLDHRGRLPERIHLRGPPGRVAPQPRSWRAHALHRHRSPTACSRRCGSPIVVLPRIARPVFEAVRRQLDDHTHGAMQAVLADFIDGGHFNAHLRRMRALYHERRDALVAACARALPEAVVRSVRRRAG